MSNFKVGDKVYCPSIGTGVYTLVKSKRVHEWQGVNQYPLSIINQLSFYMTQVTTFTIEGKSFPETAFPLLFRVNGFNKQLLEKLYNVRFEDRECTGQGSQHYIEFPLD